MKRTEKPTGQSGTDRNANSTNRAQGNKQYPDCEHRFCTGRDCRCYRRVT
ncbi:hypothetical protein [Campylobacter phage CJLB-4]|nr:hypothetical protein [Campylobacter phage CJLB-4]